MYDTFTQTLKLGILLDSFEVPEWIYLMLKKIQNSDYSEINLIILNNIPKEKKVLSSRNKSSHKYFLYFLYKKLDEKFFYSDPNPFEIKNIYKFLEKVPTIKIIPEQSEFSDRVIDDDINKIKSYELDIIIHLGLRNLRGKILQSSKFGVWSFYHDDNKINRGFSPGFWEVMEAHPSTDSILQIFNENIDEGQSLIKSYSPTHQWSPPSTYRPSAVMAASVGSSLMANR